MRSKRLPGLPVLSITSGTQLGRVKRTLIDPQNRKVIGLTITGARFGGRKVLPMEAVHALGSHAVTVSQPDALKSPKDESLSSIMSENIKVVGSPVITVQGVMVGTVQDFAIGQNGLIETLFLSRNLWKALAGGELQVPGDLIIALGEDAVVVSNEVETLTPVEHESQSKSTVKDAKASLLRQKLLPNSSPPNSKPE